MRDDVLGDGGDVQALTMHEEGVASDGGARGEIESLVQRHRDRWEREVVPADGAPPPVARVRAEVRTRGESGERAGRQGVPHHHLLLGRRSLLSMAQQQCPTENGHQC